MSVIEDRPDLRAHAQLDQPDVTATGRDRRMGAEPSQERLRVFCFPPSGASGRMYELWRPHVGPSLELIGIDYPGRGSRAEEAPIMHLETLAEMLADALMPETELPFAVLGHSMGGLVAFEVARCLTERNRSPLHLITCACRPPGQNTHKLIHQLPDEQFIAELGRRLGRKRLDAMEDTLPLLRADVTAAERYWAPPERCLDCALSVIGGLDDELYPRSSLALWSQRTSGRFSLQFVAGGHFFRGHLDAVAAVITAELDRTLAELSMA
jgi:medium-chain acyl-[acyl-carrier-protein] hydrolase